MVTAAVIQARMSSSRFPGKMLAQLRGQSLIQYLCEHLSTAKRLDTLVVATSEDTDDDLLAAAVVAAGFKVFRGSLDDVLSRFAGAARSVNADVAVRVTGDCPLIDVGVLDEMIDRFLSSDMDYLSNVSPPTYPDGLDLEIVRMSAVKTAEKEARAGKR